MNILTSGRVVNRLRYWLLARRCTCRGYPHRLYGGTVELGGVLHRADGPCYQCDEYGRPGRMWVS